MRRLLHRIVAAATLTILAVGGIAGVAAADIGTASTTVVDGEGSLLDDFSDHRSELGGDLCVGCANSGNTDLVVMWQSILVAEGFMTISQIDGQFGTATKNATINWQNRFALSDDGRVGADSWSSADDRLRDVEGGVYYDAVVGTGRVTFSRPIDGGNYRLNGVEAKDGKWATTPVAHKNIYLRSRTAYFGSIHQPSLARIGLGASDIGVTASAYVDGALTVKDDWGDNVDGIGGSLCNGCANSHNTDAVVLWQSILVAEGMLALGDIDGDFGTKTTNATKIWQSKYGLDNDGSVGDLTWGTADGQLTNGDGVSDVFYFPRNGTGRVAFTRAEGGTQPYELNQVRDPSGRSKSTNATRIYFKSRSIYLT